MDGNQLEVEVDLDGYVCRAFVEDVKPYELEVSFENNWKPPAVIEFKRIRFPPDENEVRFKEHQIVEVRLGIAREKVSYWKKAILWELNEITGEATVEYIVQDSEGSRPKVPISDIRLANRKPPIGQSTLAKVEIEIPHHLRRIAAMAGIHDEFRKEVLADCCKFISRFNILRLISKNGELTRRKVDLLKVSHINFLDSEEKLERNSEERREPKLEQKSEPKPEGKSEQERLSTHEETPKFSEVFKVKENLMGLALGKKYANVREARKMKDVISVKLDEDTLSFHVCGKTEEAVKAVRNMLEYREHFSTMPRYLAEELLEDGGKRIEEIVEQSGLVRIEAGEDDDDDESEDYPIVFVGNPSCIEIAKTLLEYQLKLIYRKLQKRQNAESESAIFNDSNLVVERIPMKQELKGLAIGKNSENLKKAQNIPGVVRIDAPLKMPMIIIHAQNEEAAQAARRVLEFDEDTVEVDRNSLGRIIGKGGVTIKQIESLSEGVRVKIPSKVQDSDLSSTGKVIIKVCGPAHKMQATIDLIKRAELFGRL